MIIKELDIQTEPTEKGESKGFTVSNLKILSHRYEPSDIEHFQNLYRAWEHFDSVGEFFDQRINIPEGLTEGIVAKDIPDVYRYKKCIKNPQNGKTKFDCYDIKNNKVIEVKAASINPDLTSWSPDPFFDLLYFVDFSSRDGKYKIYKINLNSKMLMNVQVSKTETFADQVNNNRKKRPRFPIHEHFIDKKYLCTGVPVFEGDLFK